MLEKSLVNLTVEELHALMDTKIREALTNLITDKKVLRNTDIIVGQHEDDPFPGHPAGRPSLATTEPTEEAVSVVMTEFYLPGDAVEVELGTNPTDSEETGWAYLSMPEFDIYVDSADKDKKRVGDILNKRITVEAPFDYDELDLNSETEQKLEKYITDRLLNVIDDSLDDVVFLSSNLSEEDRDDLAYSFDIELNESLDEEECEGEECDECDETVTEENCEECDKVEECDKTELNEETFTDQIARALEKYKTDFDEEIEIVDEDFDDEIEIEDDFDDDEDFEYEDEEDLSRFVDDDFDEEAARDEENNNRPYSNKALLSDYSDEEFGELLLETMDECVSERTDTIDVDGEQKALFFDGFDVAGSDEVEFTSSETSRGYYVRDVDSSFLLYVSVADCDCENTVVRVEKPFDDISFSDHLTLTKFKQVVCMQLTDALNRIDFEAELRPTLIDESLLK